MSDVLHMPPIRAPRRFWMGMFGACAAPIFWLGQLMLGYWVTAVACYGSDHPTVSNQTSALRGMLMAFDVIAIFACAAGAILSYLVLRSTNESAQTGNQVSGRVRFLGIWGLLSSLWFSGAILFNSIASLGVPLCAP
ncbi:MAG TPA: hypothetical protein VMF58_05180 [Rhizomicrobium sp.]|nr:hypothetical protein [Rhizomicrobium sp.]